MDYKARFGKRAKYLPFFPDGRVPGWRDLVECQGGCERHLQLRLLKPMFNQTLACKQCRHRLREEAWARNQQRAAEREERAEEERAAGGGGGGEAGASGQTTTT